MATPSEKAAIHLYLQLSMDGHDLAFDECCELWAVTYDVLKRAEREEAAIESVLESVRRNPIPKDNWSELNSALGLLRVAFPHLDGSGSATDNRAPSAPGEATPFGWSRVDGLMTFKTSEGKVVKEPERPAVDRSKAQDRCQNPNCSACNDKWGHT